MTTKDSEDYVVIATMKGCQFYPYVFITA